MYNNIGPDITQKALGCCKLFIRSSSEHTKVLPLSKLIKIHKAIRMKKTVANE